MTQPKDPQNEPEGLVLVMYHSEQNSLRCYDCIWECWVDMKDIYVSEKFKERKTSLTMLVAWGWEMIGEL